MPEGKGWHGGRRAAANGSKHNHGFHAVWRLLLRITEFQFPLVMEVLATIVWAVTGAIVARA